MSLENYEKETIDQLRETYKNDEWFKDIPDGMIASAWSRTSEDSCAGWLIYSPGWRDSSFEEYLKLEILKAKKEADAKETPILRARVQELEDGFKHLRRLAEDRKSGRDPGVALEWIKDVCASVLKE